MKVLILLITLISTYATQIIESERLRVLYSELERGLILLCPETGSPNPEAPNKNINGTLIYWVNETNIINIPDNQIPIASLMLLTPFLNDRFYFVFTRPLTELSCGYFFNNRYTRIKKWSLTYVDKPEVQIRRKVDENYFKLTSFNSTFYIINYQIPNTTLTGLTKSRDIFKLDCVPNFDRPLIITTLIWLHFVKNDGVQQIFDETFQMAANSEQVYPDDMQIFEGADRKVEFITFLKNLYNSPDKNSVYINLQCASYTEGFSLGAESMGFNLIKDDSLSSASTSSSTGMVSTNNTQSTVFSGIAVVTSTVSTTVVNSNLINSRNVGLSTLEIVLICVFSIVGLIIILSLVIFLCFTC